MTRLALAAFASAASIGCGASAPVPRATLPPASKEVPAPPTDVRLETIATACAGRDVDAAFELYAHAGIAFERCKDAQRPDRECAQFPPSPDGFMDSDERVRCQAEHPAIDECRAWSIGRDGKARPIGDCSLGSPLLDVRFDPDLRVRHLRSEGATLLAEASVAGRSVDEIQAQYRLAHDRFQATLVAGGVNVFRLLLRRDGGAWSIASDLGVEAYSNPELTGTGPWMGGRIIAPVLDREQNDDVRFVVLAGDAAAPGLPAVLATPDAPGPKGEEAELAEWASRADGHALLAWARTPGRNGVVWEWFPGEAKPRVRTFVDTRFGTLDPDSRAVALGPGGDAWLGASVDGAARILRRQDGRWTVSQEWRPPEGPPYPSVNVGDVALGQDGAVWVVVGGRHTELAGIWRRVPGAANRWEQLASASFHMEKGPWPYRILPLEGGDALASVASDADGRSRATLVRIHVEHGRGPE